VTCAELNGLDPDDRLLLAPLAEHDVEAEPVSWDEPDIDWSRYHLVVLRSAWDYPGRRLEFVDWAARVPALANPADVVAWNTDKRYLADLAGAGVPVVATQWVAPDGPWPVPASGEWVIKPAVGAGSLDSGRYDLGLDEHRRLACAHVARLRCAGRVVMVQPYLSAVDGCGETALLFIAGRYSHAIRKGAMLTGPDGANAVLYRPERIRARRPSERELAVARQALAAVPGGPDRLLYARIDLIPNDDGEPVLIELELTEPSLYLGTAPGAAQRFAAAIAAWAAG
jgi:hypothetical protein